ncbi:MAG: alcohol dehydrogenase catalytic domain-containing protein [Clostridia bacterium]|nr:alcohol dehydrogenase catalytic domain-containing protein [Clostridia bacterium]
MKSYTLQKAKKLVLETLPSQAITSKEFVKVKIDLAAITTTDLKIFSGKYKVPTPITLGRQAVGVVSEVMPDNANFLQKGNRVIIEGFLSCGECYFCRMGETQKCENMHMLGYSTEGVFSDFTIVHQSLLHLIPDQMPDTVAIFAEYVSMALNIIDKLNLKAGDHVAIMGASKLGYVLAQLVTYYQGIAIAIDNNADQLEKLAAENINYTQNSSKANWKDNIHGITGGRMCEKVVFLTESKLHFNDAIDICGKNGTICLAGFLPTYEKCDLTKLHRRQISMISVRNSQGNFPAAINMLATKKVNVKGMQTETFRFAELPEKLMAMTPDETKYTSIQFRID